MELNLYKCFFSTFSPLTWMGRIQMVKRNSCAIVSRVMATTLAISNCIFLDWIQCLHYVEILWLASGNECVLSVLKGKDTVLRYLFHPFCYLFELLIFIWGLDWFPESCRDTAAPQLWQHSRQRSGKSLQQEGIIDSTVGWNEMTCFNGFPLLFQCNCVQQAGPVTHSFLCLLGLHCGTLWFYWCVC